MRYPTHLLLTFQWYDEDWWLKDSGMPGVNLSCSGEERESVLPHSLAFNFLQMDVMNDPDLTTAIGIVSACM